MPALDGVGPTVILSLEGEGLGVGVGDRMGVHGRGCGG